MRKLLSSALAVVVLAPAAGAQRADLSGTWVAAVGQTPATLPAAPGPILGARFSLSIDAANVTLTRPGNDGSVTLVLPLDGARATLAVPGRLCEGERLIEETIKWEGDALVLTVVGSTPAGGGARSGANTRRLLRLEGPDRIVVEATMVQQGQSRQVGAVYQRSTEPLPPLRPAPPITTLPAMIRQVAWIGTDWRGTTGAITTEERWTPPASGGMMATARTLRGEALASFEFLCIAERGGSLAYIAMPDARTPATYFYLTAITDSSATFENPAHDYPKMIRYSRTADGGLETTIAGANGARPRTALLRRAATTP